MGNLAGGIGIPPLRFRSRRQVWLQLLSCSGQLGAWRRPREGHSYGNQPREDPST